MCIPPFKGRGTVVQPDRKPFRSSDSSVRFCTNTPTSQSPLETSNRTLTESDGFESVSSGNHRKLRTVQCLGPCRFHSRRSVPAAEPDIEKRRSPYTEKL